jgi:hypothetical protein
MTLCGDDLRRRPPSSRVRFAREQWTRVALASELARLDPVVDDPSVGAGVKIIILGAGAAGAKPP